MTSGNWVLTHQELISEVKPIKNPSGIEATAYLDVGEFVFCSVLFTVQLVVQLVVQ